jgi:hypothetical protein
MRTAAFRLQENGFHNWAIFFDEETCCDVQRIRLAILNCNELKWYMTYFRIQTRPECYLALQEWWLQRLKYDSFEYWRVDRYFLNKPR